MNRKTNRLMAAITSLSVASLLLAACGAEATPTTAPVPPTSTTAAAAAPTDTTAAAMPTNTAAMAAPTDTAAPVMTATAAVTATAAMTATAPPANTAPPGVTVAAATGTSVVSTGTSAGPTPGLPSSCSNVDLSYWSGLTGPDGPVMQQIINSFNTDNPNVKVTMTIQQDYVTALGTAKASKTLPDLTQVNEDQVATQAFLGTIRPMDDIIKLMGIQSSDFPAVAWNAGTVVGKQYTVPLSFVAMTMYYNADLLKAAGINSPPTNDSEFQAAAAAANKNGNNGFLITSGFPVQQIFQELLHQYGGTEFSSDGTQATWNSDAGVKALTWMVDAQKKYSQPKLAVDADLNGFKQGTAGMIWNGSWQLPNLTGDAVSFAGKAAAPPQIGPNPATWAGGNLMAVTTARAAGADPCKDAAEAMFYRYLIDHDADWAKAGNIPAYTPARNSDEFKQNPLAPLTQAVANPVFPPPIPGVPDAFGPLGDAVASVMQGNQPDIKKALDDAANKSNQILTQNKAKYGSTPPGQ